VIGTAQVMSGGDNPRFVVTNLAADGFAGEEDGERCVPVRLYEQTYGPPGEMDNVLK
jgi:hypothetical protein